MNIRCPKCDQPCGLSACSHCGFSLTLGSIWDHYRDRFQGVFSLRCPKCQCAVPIPARACGHCGTRITIRTAVEDALEEPRRQWAGSDVRRRNTMRRFVQWGYIVLSFFFLWAVLEIFERVTGKSWFAQAALTTFYLAISGVLAQFLVSRHFLRSLFFGPSRLMKLALLLNFLSSLLLLLLFIGATWNKSFRIAVEFMIIIVAGMLFLRYLLPLANNLIEALAGSTDHRFDSRDPQGRDVRWD